MKLTKNLKVGLAVFLSIIFLVGLLVFISFQSKKKAVTSQAPARKVEQINVLGIKDRPFVTLSPRPDGREVTLTVDKVKNATQLEYELEYEAASLIQGVFGTIDFSKETQPVSKNLLFGSCSKGKCRFDEGVTGGTLVLRFEGGPEAYVLKTDFNLQQMFDREGVFISKDAKATLDVGKTGLPNATFVIVSGTLGLPQEIEGEVVAGPYAFLAASSPTIKGTVTLKSKEDLTGAKLMFWNGKAYVALKATVAEGELTAPVTGLGIFVVVK